MTTRRNHAAQFHVTFLLVRWLLGCRSKSGTAEMEAGEIRGDRRKLLGVMVDSPV
jgi:hypothetical protein